MITPATTIPYTTTTTTAPPRTRLASAKAMTAASPFPRLCLQSKDDTRRMRTIIATAADKARPPPPLRALLKPPPTSEVPHKQILIHGLRLVRQIRKTCLQIIVFLIYLLLLLLVATAVDFVTVRQLLLSLARSDNWTSLSTAASDNMSLDTDPATNPLSTTSSSLLFSAPTLA